MFWLKYRIPEIQLRREKNKLSAGKDLPEKTEQLKNTFTRTQ